MPEGDAVHRAAARLQPLVGQRIAAESPRPRARAAHVAEDPTRTLGETLLDQSLVSGIGNMWMAELHWTVKLSPRRRLADRAEEECRSTLETAAASMAVTGARHLGAWHRVGERPPGA